jgi:hypothetical protein
MPFLVEVEAMEATLHTDAYAGRQCKRRKNKPENLFAVSSQPSPLE